MTSAIEGALANESAQQGVENDPEIVIQQSKQPARSLFNDIKSYYITESLHRRLYLEQRNPETNPFPERLLF
jgi:hypothetical protein